MKSRILLWMFLAAFLSFGLAACGSSGSSSGGAGLNNATSVTGTVYSTSGDPVPGTTVYLPGVTVTAQRVKASRTFLKAVEASDGTECEDPASADSAVASCCTAADGSFTCDTSGVTTNPEQIVFQRGALRKVAELSCSGGGECALSSDITTFGNDTGTTTWPNVAVVTGSYDRMEDVLAKLADSNTADETNGQYGRVCNTGGNFIYGSEYGTNLTIIDGTGSLTPVENTAQVSYNTWQSYLDGTHALVSDGSPVFDVIFVNCGNSYESNLADSNVLERLQNYVDSGGRLYVTDLSYDYIEQPFPQFMQYENDPADPDTPGTIGAAQVGTSGVTVDAAVNETSMSSWLGDVTVNRHDATTPGNPDNDCGTGTTDADGITTYDQITGALTSDDLIPLGDFLSGWAQMVGAHTGYSPTIWISSGAGVTFDGLANRPLTVSMSQGSSGGALYYSSYHTAHSCPTISFWPQERVLQNLIFSAL